MNNFISFLYTICDSDKMLLESILNGYSAIFENKLYHYGDLGKGSDTYLGRMGASDVGTGHFGTGTYFVSEINNNMAKNRPSHIVDSSKYKLYRPSNESNGFKLHNILKQANYLVSTYPRDNLTVRIQKVNDLINSYFSASIDITNIVIQAIKEYDSEGINSKKDSVSTRIIKLLGYDGIDVSGYDGLDNTMYGSVIYGAIMEAGMGGSIRLYRGLQQEYSDNYDRTKTDAPNGYSTWTDNPKLARQYAGVDGHIYYLELPTPTGIGTSPFNRSGTRVLVYRNVKSCGLNGVCGKEYLVNENHPRFWKEDIKLFE